MIKNLVLAVAITALTACTTVTVGTSYPVSHAVVVSSAPEYSLVAVGYPHAHFEKQHTGYKITYIKNGRYHVTFSPRAYGPGAYFYN